MQLVILVSYSRYTLHLPWVYSGSFVVNKLLIGWFVMDQKQFKDLSGCSYEFQVCVRLFQHILHISGCSPTMRPVLLQSLGPCTPTTLHPGSPYVVTTMIKHHNITKKVLWMFTIDQSRSTHCHGKPTWFLSPRSRHKDSEFDTLQPSFGVRRGLKSWV